MIQGNPQQGADAGCLFILMLPLLVIVAMILTATASRENHD